MIRRWLGLLALALVVADAHAEPKRWVPVPGKSVVAFDALFPTGNFTGQTEDLAGEFQANPAELRHGVTGWLRVNPASLRTGLDGRDRDMWALLDVGRYPEIRFTLQRLESSFHSVTDRGDVLLTISGVMTIRGVERPMIFSGRLRQREDKLWARGESKLKMTEVGIRPPTRLLMSVGDEITVRFDLLLAADQAIEGSR